MIEISNLCKSYGRQKVLDNLSLELKEGSLTGITGRNGSGKSTLLEILAGVITPDTGSFSIDGRTVSGAYLSHEIGYVPQVDPLVPELSSYDNLLLWNDKADVLRQLSPGGAASMLGINSFLKKKASKLSGGMKKRLSIASVLIRSPRMLLLDEPTTGLDLEGKNEIEKFLVGYTAEGRTVLVVSHDLSLLKDCIQIFILKEGKAVRYEGVSVDGLSECL